MNVWIQFVLSAMTIVVAGVVLARAAQVLARHTRLGGLWVGAVLLAGASSLPEVVTSISSGLIGAPDIGVGNLLGSNTLNILVIALLDFMDGRASILRKVSPSHLLSATMGLMVTALASMAILARLGLRLGWIGVDTGLIFTVYVFGLILLARFEGRSDSGVSDEGGAATGMPRMWLVYTGFVLAALATMGAGLALVRSADHIAAVTGLGSTFVGSTMVALVTSLPELVIGATLVLRGALDIAIGNIMGSNFLNMALLLAVDAAYRPGPVLLAVSPLHALTGLSALLLISIAIIGLIYRSERSYAGLGPDSVFILAVYGITAYILFRIG